MLKKQPLPHAIFNLYDNKLFCIILIWLRIFLWSCGDYFKCCEKVATNPPTIFKIRARDTWKFPFWMWYRQWLESIDLINLHLRILSPQPSTDIAKLQTWHVWGFQLPQPLRVNILQRLTEEQTYSLEAI